MDLHHLKDRSKSKVLGDFLLAMNRHMRHNLIGFYISSLRDEICECLEEGPSRRQGEQWGMKRGKMIIISDQNLVFIPFFNNNSLSLGAGVKKKENSVRGTHIAYSRATFPFRCTYLAVLTKPLDQQMAIMVYHLRVWLTLSVKKPISVRQQFKAVDYTLHEKPTWASHNLQVT